MSVVPEVSPAPSRVQPEGLFKRILLPIDGSELSLRALGTGLDLAKTFGARVLILHVVPPFNSVAYMTEFLAATELRYSQHAVQSASRYLDQATELAKQAQIAYECHYVFGERPSEAIVAAAEEHHCDLIVMATHGRSGLNRLVLGSETQKVLMRSRVPVLVCR